MLKAEYSSFFELFVTGDHFSAHFSAQVECDERIPPIAFAAQELENALNYTGRENYKLNTIC